MPLKNITFLLNNLKSPYIFINVNYIMFYYFFFLLINLKCGKISGFSFESRKPWKDERFHFDMHNLALCKLNSRNMTNSKHGCLIDIRPVTE